MTSLALELGRTVLSWLFVTYTVVAVSHYLFQLVFAHRTYRLQRSEAFTDAFPDGSMAVDVVVPSYNEDPALLEACVRSAFGQDHRGPVRVIVVDDGSPNRAALDATYDRLEADGAIVIRSPSNVGKRHAQALALPRCEGEVIVTVDSDTVLAPDAIRRLTRQFRDPRVGAATGFVDVLNRRKNFLTRIQRIRYWMAFKQERAAQSWFRTVLCCSGPLAAYRRNLIEQVAPAYLSQHYGGVACTFGDDRHLTNLILGTGHDTVFDAGAVAYTNVPENLRQFLRQQLRWSKSFYRELVWTLPFIGSRPWYSRFDLACLVGMPMMLTLTAGVALLFGALIDPFYLLHFAAFITLAAGIRITYAVVRERDPRMYLFIVYGFVSAFLLLSVRLVAMSTLTDARWGTRGTVRVEPPTTGRLARLRSTIQPTGLVVAPVSWPSASGRSQPGAEGARTRFDGAWRAGVAQTMMAHPTRMMAHPAALPDQAGPIVAASLSATATSAVPASARPVGPICRHAVRPGARFCRACGARYAPLDTPGVAPAAEPAMSVGQDQGSLETWDLLLDRIARIDPMSVWPPSSIVRPARPLMGSSPRTSAKRARKQPGTEPMSSSAAAGRGNSRKSRAASQPPESTGPSSQVSPNLTIKASRRRAVAVAPSPVPAAEKPPQVAAPPSRASATPKQGPTHRTATPPPGAGPKPATKSSRRGTTASLPASSRGRSD
jgi:hyaluronan synthase/N-acetylglucosaminyltransferase